MFDFTIELRGDVMFGVEKVRSREETEKFVRVLYRAVLRREPDDAGLLHYVNLAQNGCSCTSIVEEFIDSSEFREQTTNRLFVPPGHFYSPIVDVAEAARYLTSLDANPIPEQLGDVFIDRFEMIRTWHSLLPFLTTIPFPDSKDPAFRYAFDNPAYSYADGSILHSMLRRYRPKRLFEIGSGWSSACSLDTVEQFLNGTCEITFIEPYPHLLRQLLGEVTARVRIFDKPVQQMPLAIFDELEEGDFLFIDSTHILRTGSDVCFELFEILPRLRRGVFVHFHDMLWPFEYPKHWIIQENRSWNELYAVRAFLSHNFSWRIILFNDYLAKLERLTIEATYPKFLRNTGGALWLLRQ